MKTNFGFTVDAQNALTLMNQFRIKYLLQMKIRFYFLNAKTVHLHGAGILSSQDMLDICRDIEFTQILIS